MRTSLSLNPSAHGAIELTAGLATLILPFALGFGPAPLLVCVALGAILTGAALDVAGGGSIRAAHISFDSVFVLGTAVAALALATAGQTGAVILLTALVVVQAGLGFTTRYTAAG